jgi:uncharacterized protein
VQGEGAGFSSQTWEELRAITASATMIVHGVGLSIGSHDGWCERYLHLLDQLFEQVEIAWHSEHLAYTMVDGEILGTMLTLPRTEKVLNMVCDRITTLQQRYHAPFLLEHAISLLPEFEGDYSQAGFLNALTERTGCGLILDAYNLECDAYNQSLDIASFLAELRLEHVREIHLANGVNYHGFQLDVHSRPTRQCTIALAYVVARLHAGAVLPSHHTHAKSAAVLRRHHTDLCPVTNTFPIYRRAGRGILTGHEPAFGPPAGLGSPI